MSTGPSERCPRLLLATQCAPSSSTHPRSCCFKWEASQGSLAKLRFVLLGHLPERKKSAKREDRVNFRSAWRPAGMLRHNQQRSVEEGRSLLGGTYAMKSVKPSVDIISPTHKRTEGRAPVWGSEFTSKRRRTTGGIQQKPLLG
jgi:hypothetical protein